MVHTLEGPASSRSFETLRDYIDRRLCVGERCVAVKDEPRAYCTLSYYKYFDSQLYYCC